MMHDILLVPLGIVFAAGGVAAGFLLLRSVAGPLDALVARIRRPRLRAHVTAYLLLLPSAVILGVFGIAPLLYAAVLSLYATRRGVGPYVRFGNYARAFDNPEFWNSVSVTLWYALGTVPVTLVASFIIANALNRIVRGRGLFRTAYFLPYVTSTVAAAMVWRLFFQPRYGLANALLVWLGFQPSQWLLEPRGVLFYLTDGRVPPDLGPSVALVCVMLFDIWHSSGFMIVILLAALAAIPRELEDAARIDGANGFQTIRNVVIPLISPTLFFLVIISLIRAFQAFNSFYALTGTGRGPNNSTQSLTVYIYSAFEYGRWGYGCAVATVLAAGIILLTLAQWRVLGRRVHYE
jgi:ABC-type sugar transport system permease subunit